MSGILQTKLEIILMDAFIRLIRLIRAIRLIRLSTLAVKADD